MSECPNSPNKVHQFVGGECIWCGASGDRVKFWVTFEVPIEAENEDDADEKADKMLNALPRLSAVRDIETDEEYQKRLMR